MKKFSKFQQLNISQLEYVVLSGKEVPKRYQHLHAEMYHFWRKNWESVYREVLNKKSIGSDIFLRQYEVAALLYCKEIVGVFFLDIFDLDSSVTKEHSYFSEYPSELLNTLSLRKIGPCFFINNLAIDPQFRGDFGLSDIMVGLKLKRLEQSLITNIVCYTRNSRRTNEIMYRWSGQVLLKEQVAHGEPSDFFIFNRNSFSESQSHPLFFAVQKLWDQRVHTKNYNLYQNNEEGELNEFDDNRTGLFENDQGY